MGNFNYHALNQTVKILRPDKVGVGHFYWTSTAGGGGAVKKQGIEEHILSPTLQLYSVAIILINSVCFFLIFDWTFKVISRN